MNNTLTQSPSAKPSSLVLDLKNGIKNNINKFLGKAETSTTTAKNSLQADIGKTKAFSNRTSPELNTKTAESQSKQVSNTQVQDNKEINNIKSASASNGKEIGADLKVPGCSGGCGCGCK
jgi:hypothetical protein